VMSEGKLEVFIEECPAVAHIKKCGLTPSKWFVETTSTVYRVIAEEAGLRFDMISYDDDTGKAHFCFKA
jgi:hypothetical protein